MAKLDEQLGVMLLCDLVLPDNYRQHIQVRKGHVVFDLPEFTLKLTFKPHLKLWNVVALELKVKSIAGYEGYVKDLPVHQTCAIKAAINEALLKSPLDPILVTDHNIQSFLVKLQIHILTAQARFLCQSRWINSLFLIESSESLLKVGLWSRPDMDKEGVLFDLGSHTVQGKTTLMVSVYLKDQKTPFDFIQSFKFEPHALDLESLIRAIVENRSRAMLLKIKHILLESSFNFDESRVVLNAETRPSFDNELGPMPCLLVNYYAKMWAKLFVHPRKGIIVIQEEESLDASTNESSDEAYQSSLSTLNEAGKHVEAMLLLRHWVFFIKLEYDWTGQNDWVLFGIRNYSRVCTVFSLHY